SDSRSDKVYNVTVVERTQGLYAVEASWGRRGQWLQTGTKTASPVGLDKAMAIFEKTVREKLAKGYKVVGGGTAPAVARSADEGRSTGIEPQLLTPIDEGDEVRYVDDGEYVAQEKFDGRRVLVEAGPEGVRGINRRGLVIPLPARVAACAERLGVAAGGMLVDGELVGDTLVAFDLLEAGGVSIRYSGYCSRLVLLASIVGDGADEPIRVAETASGADAKRTLVARLRAGRKEGVVFKHAASKSRPGRGGTDHRDTHVKLKFYATASFVVARQNDKRSVAIALGDDGVLRDVGNVTIPPSAEIPPAGSVIEVRYLYAYEGGAVYQPVYLGVRDDVAQSECLMSQLKLRPASDRPPA
ncbi:MAG: WGR domain-containing protein, partial [Acidobacteria bacterium]|nr:WGR domain-containing protein [Acidobacteriota bacterium]